MSNQNKLLDIRAKFLLEMDEEGSFPAVVDSVESLRRAGLAKDVHEACTIVTRWAVEEGYVPEYLEDTAETQAEDMVKAISA